MTDEKPHRSYYPALDGVRGVAILLVIFLHNFGFLNYFFFGWIGVDLFFVLSGFLITEILLKSVGQPHYLRNFYIRRILRIFPLYYLTLMFCFWVLPNIISSYINIDYYTDHQSWLWTYTQNWLYIFKTPYGTKMLLHTWSLAVEEQFYLIWPLVILLVRKPKILLAITLILLLLTGACRFVLWEYKIKDLAYASFYTFTRIDGLCIGATLALLLHTYPGFLKKYTTVIVLLMAAINFAFYFLNGQYSFTLPYLAFVGYTTFAMLFGILVYEAVMGRSVIINFIFTNIVLRFFGRISYGLYVYHWPVYILLFPFFRKHIFNLLPFSPRLVEISTAIAVTGVTVILSTVSYRYFESYFLRFKKRYT